MHMYMYILVGMHVSYAFARVLQVRVVFSLK